MSTEDVKTLVHPVGTIILCENHHAVCEVIKDLYRGDLNYSESIGNWKEGQTPAQRGQELPLRCYCGGIYFGGPGRKIFQHYVLPYQGRKANDNPRLPIKAMTDGCETNGCVIPPKINEYEE